MTGVGIGHLVQNSNKWSLQLLVISLTSEVTGAERGGSFQPSGFCS